MKKILVILLTTVSIIACKNDAKKDDSSAKKMEDSKLETTCYSYTKSGDSIYMKVEKSAENVSGTLDISYAEKDKNSGTFAGKMHSDTLSALYTFNSEGMQSTREIIFLVKKNQLLEGFGPMNAEGTHFKNRDSITFSNSMPLTLTDCKN